MSARRLRCRRCGELKEPVAFSRDRSRDSARFQWCKTCVNATRKETRRDRHVGEPGSKECPVCLTPLGGTHAGRVYCSNSCKDKARRYRTFGLSPGEYRELHEATGGRCPICRKQVKVWALDHDHTTGETLGLTCSICNHQLLAYAYHDPEIVTRLLAFLQDPPVRAMFGERRYVGPESLSQLHRMWAWNGEPEPVAA
jgi:hypothetical protein